MKIIKARNKLDKGILFAALILAVLPITGLLSGVSISMGLYGMNYQEVALQDNTPQYWFVIKLEFAVVFFYLLRAKYCFPLFDAAYQRLIILKNNNKLIAYTLLYLVIPICVVALCFFLMSYFQLS